MESEELLRRAEDLARRCEKLAAVTGTAFLTLAEQAELQRYAAARLNCTVLFRGGHPDCERKAAFFLPDYLDADCFAESDHLTVLRAAAGFGEPGHRDYLGAALGLGIRRDFLGDIWISGSMAYLFCLPSVAPLMRDSLQKVGRFGVRLTEVPLSEVSPPERRVQVRSFTVMSARLDAVLAGLFGLSRPTAVSLIRAGAASLNDLPCLKPDALLEENDVVSLRGYGKGVLRELGGTSRKGRTFVRTELYV